MRDVMTENREKRVWALAKGGDLKIDDSNVPAGAEDRLEQAGAKSGRLVRLTSTRRRRSNT